jgi:hypothetical protein
VVKEIQKGCCCCSSFIGVSACSDEEILSFGICGVNFGELENRERAGESLYFSFEKGRSRGRGFICEQEKIFKQKLLGRVERE